MHYPFSTDDTQVRAAGRYVTVLLDPHSFDTVISDSESLDFTRYTHVLMERIFDLQLPHQQPAKAKSMMERYSSHYVNLKHFQFNFVEVPAEVRLFVGTCPVKSDE